MQGVILSVGRAQSLILGDDGLRYTFTPLDWQNQNITPEVGMRVDFEVRDSHAAAVYPIPDATFAPAVQPPHAHPAQPPVPTEPYTPLQEAEKRFEMKWQHWALAGGGAFIFLGVIAAVVLGSFTTPDPVSHTGSVPTVAEVPPTDATQSRQAEIHTPVPTTDSTALPVSVATPPVLTQPPAPGSAGQKTVSDRDVNNKIPERSDQTQPGDDSRQNELPDGQLASEKTPPAPTAPKTPIPTASPSSGQWTLLSQPPFFLEWEMSATDVEAGDSLTLTVRMLQPWQASEHGGISVSFPSLTEPGGSEEFHSSPVADIEALNYTSGLSNVAFHQPGATIYHRENNRQFPAQYLLVESDDPSWLPSDDRTLRLRITPKRGGEFPIQIRGWICADGYTDCSRQPESGAIEDQQGHVVIRTEPEVEPPLSYFDDEDTDASLSGDSFDAASVLARFSTPDPVEGEARADAAGEIIARYKSGASDIERVLDLLHIMAPELSIGERRRAWQELERLSEDDEWDEIEAASAVFYLGSIITGDEPNPEERIEAAQEMVELYEAGELDPGTALDLMNTIEPELSINERRQAAAALAKLSADDDWDDADKMEAASEVFRLVTGVPLNAEERIDAAVDLAGIGMRVFGAEGEFDDQDTDVAAEIIKQALTGELTDEALRNILESGN